jgi:GGDEF domain-containing protein
MNIFNALLQRSADRSKRAEAGVQLQVLHNRFVADRMPIPVLVLDQAGSIRYANRAACDQLRCAGRDRLSMSIEHLANRIVLPDWPSLWQTLQKHGEATLASELDQGKASRTPVTLVLHRIDDNLSCSAMMIISPVSVWASPQPAIYHPCSNLPGEALLSHKLTQLSQQARQQGNLLRVTCIGIDQFDLVMDVVGRTQAISVAQRVASSIRAATPQSQFLAHVDDSHFVIAGLYLPRDPPERQALRILRRCNSLISVGDHNLHVTVSTGVAIGDGSTAPQEVYQQALQALELAQARDTGMFEVVDTR